MLNNSFSYCSDEIIALSSQMYSRSSAPVLPKRGEKEFEPAEGGGSGLQKHVLERSRNAMFDILRTTRVIAK